MHNGGLVHVLAKLNDRVGYALACESSILQVYNNMSKFNGIQDGFTIMFGHFGTSSAGCCIELVIMHVDTVQRSRMYLDYGYEDVKKFLLPECQESSLEAQVLHIKVHIQFSY
jgi:hypothetical protein